ncbi:MAG: acyl carrier protein [Flavobacteriales bacterium]|nr:acyl carrier protein [Flavobacteriales bacterium]MCB9167611.1 acyl carrier protein [Flavobacteriales bacterium]
MSTTTSLRQDIESKTKAFLSEEFEVDAELVRPEAPMKETLDLDSLDYVDLVVIIEEHFGVKLTADDFAKVRTFEDFFDHIEQRVAKS